MVTSLGYGVFGLGAAVCCLNLYLSFLRMPLLRLLGRPARWMSGFPGVGTILLVLASALLIDHPKLIAAALLLALIDPGGPAWFAIAMLRQRSRGH